MGLLMYEGKKVMKPQELGQKRLSSITKGALTTRWLMVDLSDF
jgi:hypothetical protein